MAQTEFRKLKRFELVDIIYQLQEELEEQKKINEELERRLADKELKMTEAGSIAQAAVALSGLMETAQQAADQYLLSVRGLVWRSEMAARQQTADASLESEKILCEARRKAGQICDKAQKEADALRSQAQKEADALRSQVQKEAEQLRDQTPEKAEEIPGRIQEGAETRDDRAGDGRRQQ